MSGRVVAAATIALALASASARASVWSDATGNPGDAIADEVYRKALDRGDDAAAQAAQRGLRMDLAERRIDEAIQSYQTAAAAAPKAGEPYARIGKLLFSMYFEECHMGAPTPPGRSPLCPVPTRPTDEQPDPDTINTVPSLHRRAEQMLAAWDELERRSPLDPRLDRGFLFERAIIHTKLATRAHLEAAARDYEALLRRFGNDNDAVTLGNLAETYMMLGRLDDAIAFYERAVGSGSGDAIYGLAVALDRDERTDTAHQLIVDAGSSQYQDFLGKVRSYTWFFVPSGEKYYYLALAEESYGQIDAALADWAAFVRSGAHPMYQPRAKAHIAQLEMQRKLHPQILRPSLPFDPFGN